MGRMMNTYLLPLLNQFGFTSHLKHDQSVPDSAVDAQYMADTAWLVGSPDTVAEKLAAQYETLGGFGTLLLFGFDYMDDPEVWRQSMERMAKEVMPKVASLTPQATPTATG
jgi:alkanesulfonate monooxygenase SsuD/methylene tetrahydromethanopterin reductase-like flavin-dependent oxidoreductase (luciferase family)